MKDRVPIDPETEGSHVVFRTLAAARAVDAQADPSLWLAAMVHRSGPTVLGLALALLTLAPPATAQPVPDETPDELDRELNFLFERRERAPLPIVIEPWGDGLDGLLLAPADASETPRPTAPAPSAQTLSFNPDDVTDLPFGLTTVHQPELLEFLEYYNTEGRRRAASWMAAAGAWRARIEQIADEEGAPRDLVWVAAIESGYNNTARSHAGAVGMWQFMERTARSRGMRIDRWVDERMDFELSTRHAMTYLLDRYAIFGNWLTAFSAYNAGSGHARGELREASATDFFAFDDYSCLYSDARRYALRIVSLAILDRNREVFGFDSVVPAAAIEWDIVEVPGGTRLSLVAEAAGTSLSEIRSLNSSFRTNQVPPEDGSVRVRIPAGRYAAFVEEFDGAVARSGGEHENIALHFGETIERFADRVGQPERVIRAVNGLAASDRVPYGTELIVPTRGRRGSQVLAPSIPDLVLLPTVGYRYPDQTRLFYTVVRGDTPAEIAEHFGVTVWDLSAWNDLDPSSTLLSGMVLQVFVDPAFDTSATVVLHDSQVTAVAVNSPEHEAWQAAQGSARSESASSRRRTYRVRSGDTIGGIASRLGVRPADLIRWNDLNDEALIVVGQELIVSR